MDFTRFWFNHFKQEGSSQIEESSAIVFEKDLFGQPLLIYTSSYEFIGQTSQRPQFY